MSNNNDGRIVPIDTRIGYRGFDVNITNVFSTADEARVVYERCSDDNPKTPLYIYSKHLNGARFISKMSLNIDIVAGIAASAVASSDPGLKCAMAEVIARALRQTTLDAQIQFEKEGTHD